MRRISIPWVSRQNPNIPKFDDQTPGSGSLIQRMRLWSGLIILSFVLLHYINHALGNISLEAMTQMQIWRKWIWQSNVGSIVLYGAILMHISMVIWRLITRNSYRLPVWEWAQILLGLSIPYFLLTHIIAMRGPVENFGIDVDYSLGLGLMYPGAALAQNFLLFATWIHGCIGVHFWLRLNQWYTDKLTWLVSLATLLPILAMTGWLNAARQNAASMAELRIKKPESAEPYYDAIQFIFSEILPTINVGKSTIILLGWALVILILARLLQNRFKKNVKIDYGDGRIINSVPGNTLLETSRQAGIPHMSVCGGRARCSTCRTLILAGKENLSPTTTAEQELLNRLNAEDSIRLACQAKITGDVSIRPLVQPQAQYVDSNTTDPLGWGVERPIAILFLDIRGFSSIAEKSLPYDVVFILNSFFGEIATAVEQHNGYVDKFMGDGMMALFGLDSIKLEASRDALRAAIACHKSAKNVSKILTQHLAEPIKIGVGAHIGDAVIGRIGKTSDQSTPSRLTAIGDSVNISARLEQATKDFASPLVVSTEIVLQAGLVNLSEIGKQKKIKVRNISKPVEVLSIADLGKLETLLN